MMTSGLEDFASTKIRSHPSEPCNEIKNYKSGLHFRVNKETQLQTKKGENSSKSEIAGKRTTLQYFAHILTTLIFTR